MSRKKKISEGNTKIIFVHFEKIDESCTAAEEKNTLCQYIRQCVVHVHVPSFHFTLQPMAHKGKHLHHKKCPDLIDTEVITGAKFKSEQVWIDDQWLSYHVASHGIHNAVRYM